LNGGFTILDPYQRGSSVIHRLDAKTKLLLALGFIITTSAMPDKAWRMDGILFLITISMIILSQLSVIHYLKRSLLALPFLLAALPILFTLPGPSLGMISLGDLSIIISAPGFYRFLAICIKSWLCVLTAVLLTSTTSMENLLGAMRQLRIPRVLTAATALMWRYLFVIFEEALRMMRARSARSARTHTRRSGGTIAWRGKVTGGMAGSLFLRSLERSERVYNAMLSRGYDGEIRLMEDPQKAKNNSLVLTIGGVLLICLLLLGNIWK
jgi:cobalt/nickel transport system permease protein